MGDDDVSAVKKCKVGRQINLFKISRGPIPTTCNYVSTVILIYLHVLIGSAHLRNQSQIHEDGGHCI